MPQINPTYQKMIEQIMTDAEKFVNKQMSSVYKNQKKHLDELQQYMSLLYMRQGTEGLLNVTNNQRRAILSDIDRQLKAMGKDLGEQEIDEVTKILEQSYETTYYHNAYTLDFGFKDTLSFNILRQEYIDAAVNTPLAEEMFSDRIWKNKAHLVDTLRKSLVDAMNGNKHLDQIAKEVKNRFNVTAYESKRLVNNENTRVQSQAIDDIGRNTGVEKQIYTATLDNKTSKFCQAHDGIVYDIDDPNKPNIPEDSHVGCRSCYINMPFNDWRPRMRRNNETGENVEYISYEQWAKDKGINDSTTN